MGLVLACAQQHDGGDPRRESGHGARSLDWVRPIAPVAHRTERSAPDRKAAGSIPARRTFEFASCVWRDRIRTFDVGGSRPKVGRNRCFAGGLATDTSQRRHLTMQTKTNLVRVNGIELGYRVFGKGKPLVLLHGGFGSVEMFGPNIAL